MKYINNNIALLILAAGSLFICLGAVSANESAKSDKGFFPHVFKADYSDMRGFMYEPSYAWTETEAWHYFDAEIFDLEIGRGKKYFPGMNAIRTSVSIEAWRRNPKQFIENFRRFLDIAEKHDVVVMPMLFNRWHNFHLDYGGIYVDHFWRDDQGHYDKFFAPFVNDIVSTFKDDPRIFMWDIANEPMHQTEKYPDILKAELNWMRRIYKTIKQAGAKAPTTVGIWGNARNGIQLIEPISDVLSVHSYKQPHLTEKRFETRLDNWVSFAQQKSKPLVVTETAWGRDTNKERAENMRYVLGQFEKRKLGFIPVMLHWSYRIDCHDDSEGLPVGNMLNLEFINKDGSLRPEHDVVREFGF